MRKDSRKRHVYRPLNLALEARNGVSSLVPGISVMAPSAAPGNAGPQDRDGALSPSTTIKPTGTIDQSLAPVQSQPVASFVTASAVAGPAIVHHTAPGSPMTIGGGPSVPLPSILASPTLSQPSSAPVPLVPPRAPSQSASPSTSGGLLSPAPSASASQPSSAPSGTASTNAPAPVSVDPGSLGIRPMALSPGAGAAATGSRTASSEMASASSASGGGAGSTSGTGYGQGSTSGTGYGQGSTSGSGSGQGSGSGTGTGSGTGSGSGSGEPPPAVISGGWGGAGWASKDPATEFYPKGVPVGAVLNVGAYQGDSRWVIDPASIRWDGGTYKSYFSNPATDTVDDDPGLKSVQVGKINALDKMAGSYTVIADPDTQNLVITLKCAYYKNPANHAAGDTATVTTTLSAQVVKPDVTFGPGRPGTKTFTNDGTIVSIGLDPGEKIDGVTITKAFGGDFMIMQHVAGSAPNPTTITSYVDSTGKTRTLSTVGSGMNLDDGGTLNTLSVGVPLVGGGSGWSMLSNSGPVAGTEADRPRQTAPVDARSVSFNASFKSYLMYKPASGVWVALSENDWTFNWTVTNNPWPAPGPQGPAADNPDPTTPSGDNAFPSWTGDVAGRGPVP